MSVRVRLTRVGSKKNPIWRVVVADQRSPRDGRFIEAIGHYNPQTEPSTILIDEARLEHWLERGAQPTGTVKQLMKARAKGAPAAPAEAAPAAAQLASAEAAPAEPASGEPPASAEPTPGEPASAEAAPAEPASAEPESPASTEPTRE